MAKRQRAGEQESLYLDLIVAAQDYARGDLSNLGFVTVIRELFRDDNGQDWIDAPAKDFDGNDEGLMRLAKQLTK